MTLVQIVMLYNAYLFLNTKYYDLHKVLLFCIPFATNYAMS